MIVLIQDLKFMCARFCSLVTWLSWRVQLGSMPVLAPVRETISNEPNKLRQPLGNKYAVMAVTTMLASAIGSITFQPNRIN